MGRLKLSWRPFLNKLRLGNFAKSGFFLRIVIENIQTKRTTDHFNEPWTNKKKTLLSGLN
jgi:hypothetical protein